MAWRLHIINMIGVDVLLAVILLSMLLTPPQTFAQGRARQAAGVIVGGGWPFLLIALLAGGAVGGIALLFIRYPAMLKQHSLRRREPTQAPDPSPQHLTVAPRADPLADELRLWLVVRSGAQAGARLRLGQSISYLGSSPALADLVIVGQQVAGRHASARREGAGVTISDLSSGTGTLVNGAPLVPLTPYSILPGALISIGGVFVECIADRGTTRTPTEFAYIGGSGPDIPPPLSTDPDSVEQGEDVRLAERSRPAPTATLGKYRLLTPLGIGSASQVLLADDRERGGLVALKLAIGDNLPHMLATFQGEGQLGLQHRHIADVYESGVIDGQRYIALEHVAGPSLRQIFTGAPLQLALALAIIGQTLEALDHAHQRGVIHCDIKPENLLLAPHKGVKLIDFGIARHLAMPEDKAGLRAGTPQYMSYEQAAGLPVDAGSDICAVAIVLYELLTGRLPFAAASIAQAASQRRHQLPVPPRAYNPSIPYRVEAALLRAMLRERADRFATAQQFAAALGCPPDLAAQCSIDDALLASESHLAPTAPAAVTR